MSNMDPVDRDGKKVLEDANIAKQIKHDFDPLENRDAIIQYEVISRTRREEVEAEKVPYKRKDMFYDFLKVEPQGYKKFLEVLKIKDYYWLVEALEEERSKLEAAGGVRFSLDYYDNSTRTRRLTELELMKLAEHIRIKWEEVAVGLGFSQAHIFDIKVQNQNMGTLMTATNLLVQFIRRDPQKANLNYFIPKLEEHGIYLEKKDVDTILSSN